MSLKMYREKKHSKKTSKSKMCKKKSDKKIFVIQKHDASNLHYDFRISAEGVLKSWAVPKGPSTDPSQKRLAIETEDHPIEYANFEGVIPEGEYGAGTVLLWDRGSYKNIKGDDSMTKSLRNGHIEIWLNGKKIKGGYSLIKFEKKKWLLTKMKDKEADKKRNPVRTEKKSVKTGRTLKEISRQTTKKISKSIKK